MPKSTAADRALILDVDGTVSPVHGRTAWEDDVVAGQVFGPVLVSPAMCARLETLADLPRLSCAWLTSWNPEMRKTLDPFPGRHWPDIGNGHRDPAGHDPDVWWKPVAARRWLEHVPTVTRLVWCDDHIDPTLGDLAPLVGHWGEAPDVPPSTPGSSRAVELHLANLTLLLIAPATHIGLTPHDLERIEKFLNRRR